MRIEREGEDREIREKIYEVGAGGREEGARIVDKRGITKSETEDESGEEDVGIRKKAGERERK